MKRSTLAGHKVNFSPPENRSPPIRHSQPSNGLESYTFLQYIKLFEVAVRALLAIFLVGKSLV